jgi:hypothetical protein
MTNFKTKDGKEVNFTSNGVKKVAKTKKVKAIIEKNRSQAKVKKELDTKNVKDTIRQTVESSREIKYKYPEDCDNTLDKKSFRQQTRNKLKAMESAMLKADPKAKAKLEKEYKEYRKKVLLVP